MLPELGTVSAVWPAAFSHNGTLHTTADGTSLGLTLAFLEAGVAVGDLVVVSDVSTRLRPDAALWTLEADGGGDRTPGGVWAGWLRDSQRRRLMHPADIAGAGYTIPAEYNRGYWNGARRWS